MWVNVLRGFCIGAADVVPGVSGGTMALMLGIYGRLMAAIASFDAHWLRAILRFDGATVFKRPHWSLLLPLGCGLVLALFFFTRIVPLPQLLRSHPEQVYGLFFGLVLTSTLCLLVSVRAMLSNPHAWVLLLAGATLGWVGVTLPPTDSPDTPWVLFGCGLIALAAMLLPGVSGSFVLLALHKYELVLGAVGRLDFAILLPFGAGALCSVLLFSRLLGWLIYHYHRPTVLFICGILFASLRVLWPFQERSYAMVRDKERLVATLPQWPDEHWPIVLFWVAMGTLLVLVLETLSRRNQIMAAS